MFDDEEFLDEIEDLYLLDTESRYKNRRRNKKGNGCLWFIVIVLVLFMFVIISAAKEGIDKDKGNTTYPETTLSQTSYEGHNNVQGFDSINRL